MGDRDKVLREMYLEEPNGCIHDAYLGDDVLSDITEKFYWCLDTIRKEFDVFIEVYVMPSCEDSTTYLMIYESKILVKGHDKAWNFWWNTPEDIMEYMYDLYRSITRSLGELTIQEADIMDLLLKHGNLLTCFNCGKKLTEVESKKLNERAKDRFIAELILDPGEVNYPREPDVSASLYFICAECTEGRENKEKASPAKEKEKEKTWECWTLSEDDIKGIAERHSFSLEGKDMDEIAREVKRHFRADKEEVWKTIEKSRTAQLKTATCLELPHLRRATGCTRLGKKISSRKFLNRMVILGQHLSFYSAKINCY